MKSKKIINDLTKKPIKTNLYYCEPMKDKLLLIPNSTINSDCIEIIELNGVAKLIWESMENYNIQQLIATVCSWFDRIDMDILTKDTCEFLQSLFEKKAIEFID